MIAVVQRVSQAAITVQGEEVAAIKNGLVILLGVFSDDTEHDCQFLINKIINFRIFNDEAGKMNLSIKNIGGEVLAISQFTLCGDWLKGRRPSFIHAAPPKQAEELYELFIKRLKAETVPVKTGIFGAMMDVLLVNNGPVTFVLDSKIKVAVQQN